MQIIWEFIVWYFVCPIMYSAIYYPVQTVSVCLLFVGVSIWRTA